MSSLNNTIYTIILLKTVCCSYKRQVANLLDCLGRGCLKLFVSTESTTSREFAPQLGLEFFMHEKHPKNTESPARLFT